MLQAQAASRFKNTSVTQDPPESHHSMSEKSAHTQDGSKHHVAGAVGATDDGASLSGWETAHLHLQGLPWNSSTPKTVTVVWFAIHNPPTLSQLNSS